MNAQLRDKSDILFCLIKLCPEFKSKRKKDLANSPTPFLG